MFKDLDRPLHLLRIAVALAFVLLLAGPPALASSAAECEDAWEDSSASDSCNNPTISFGDYNNCEQCCLVFASCHTGESGPLAINPYNLTSIGAPVSDFDDLQNCHGTLKVGSC